jgi:F-type H+-transporting ATPase subunit epsilon
MAVKIPDSVKFFIASASGRYHQVDTQEIYVETDDGDIGILPGHQPEFHLVTAGFVRWKEEEGEKELAVFDGFLQIEPDAVRIGCKEALKREEVNVSELEKKVEELEENVKSYGEEAPVEEEEKLRVLKEFLRRLKQ